MNKLFESLTHEELFCLEGCRTYKQYHGMRKGFEGNRCVFCDVDRDINNILFEDTHVLVWHVPHRFMRDELIFHWLIVPKRHVRFEADLSPEEYQSALRAKQYIREQFGYEGGVTVVREGDMRKNAGTVPHLHYNTYVPRETDEVRIPVFKDPRDRAENKLRAAEFSKRYEAGEQP